MDYDYVGVPKNAAILPPRHPVSKSVEAVVVENDRQCCGCCAYWKQLNPYMTSDVSHPGKCLADPPMFGHPDSQQAANWPTTYVGDWCGKFRPVEHLAVVKD